MKFIKHFTTSLVYMQACFYTAVKLGLLRFYVFSYNKGVQLSAKILLMLTFTWIKQKYDDYTKICECCAHKETVRNGHLLVYLVNEIRILKRNSDKLFDFNCSHSSTTQRIIIEFYLG